MLREIVSVRQEKGRPLKRWFNDQDFDLFTWHRRDGSICRFELCYDKRFGEHAVTWDAREGINNFSVDDGEETGRHKMAPLMVSDSSQLDERVASAFQNSASGLDPAIVALVCAKLGLPPVRRL